MRMTEKEQVFVGGVISVFGSFNRVVRNGVWGIVRMKWESWCFCTRGKSKNFRIKLNIPNRRRRGLGWG